jgi:hypothetical protein
MNHFLSERWQISSIPSWGIILTLYDRVARILVWFRFRLIP